MSGEFWFWMWLAMLGIAVAENVMLWRYRSLVNRILSALERAHSLLSKVLTG